MKSAGLVHFLIHTPMLVCLDISLVTVVITPALAYHCIFLLQVRIVFVLKILIKETSRMVSSQLILRMSHATRGNIDTNKSSCLADEQ